LQPDSRESIIGYVTRGKGVAVHSINCRTSPIFSTSRIDASTCCGRRKDGQPVSYPVKLTLLCDDRWGMLKQITPS